MVALDRRMFAQLELRWTGHEVNDVVLAPPHHAGRPVGLFSRPVLSAMPMKSTLAQPSSRSLMCIRRLQA